MERCECLGLREEESERVERLRASVRCRSVLEDELERGTLRLCSAASDILSVLLVESLDLARGAIPSEEGSWKVECAGAAAESSRNSNSEWGFLASLALRSDGDRRGYLGERVRSGGWWGGVCS